MELDMNLPGLVIFSVILLYLIITSYDAWFRPERFVAHINQHRDLMRLIWGPLVTRNRDVDLRMVRIVSAMMIVFLLVAIVFAITGPIRN